MKKNLSAIFMFCLMTTPVWAEEENISATEMPEPTLQEMMAEKRNNIALPLNNKIDYIARNYSEKELKNLIVSYEKIIRKAAGRNGEDYIPYDRKIDLKDPQKVQRFLKKRIDIVF